MSAAPQTHDPVPLYVDLDGTLIKSDLLWESFFALFRQSFTALLLLPLWLLKGKAHLKRRIAERVALEVDVLPYDPQVIAYLQEEKAKGRPLTLATASDAEFAHSVARHLGLFDGVLASDGEHNLKGAGKLAAIRADTRGGPFDYAGNDRSDLVIWAEARQAVVVTSSPALREAAARTAEVARVIERQGPGLNDYLKALRLHQWLKNILVFLPLLAAHEGGHATAWVMAGLAFLAFGLCASAGYLFNDLLDLTADRHHHRKRHRPFAAGQLPLAHGAFMLPLLLGAAFGIAAMLAVEFIWALALYLAVTLSYSFRFKRIANLDVLVLAGLYTLRVVAGALAVGVTPSFWLLAFSMFIFLSLALVKRYIELVTLEAEGKSDARERGYRVGDMPLVQSLGASSGYLATLVLALYINSPEVRQLYQRPELIWLLCPLLLYWIGRLWLKAHRDEMHDDPLVFAVADRASQLIVVAGGIILWAAS